MNTFGSYVRAFAVIGVVVGTLFYLFYGSAGSPGNDDSLRPNPKSDIVSTESKQKKFAGYECTADCSGHEAGYNWAEEHNISDGDDCDTAGEHSNSPSFAEGCHAYIDGENDPPADDSANEE